MTLTEADGLFPSTERLEALQALLKYPLNNTHSGAPGADVRLCGLPGSSAAMLFARLPEGKMPCLIVADDAESAGYLYHDLCQITGNEETAAIFPSGYKRHIKYGQPDAPSQILRTETLNALQGSRSLKWVVTYPEALAEKVPLPEGLSEATLTLRKGEKRDVADILVKLREMGFREVDYVYEPGQFARRGSILDVFSYSNEFPYRIDFFDDEIDSLRTFNVETQLSMEKLEEVSLLAAAGAPEAGGVSLPEFMESVCATGKNGGKKGGAKRSKPVGPVYIFRSMQDTLLRIRAVCRGELSESVLISGEGDTRALENTVDPEALERCIGEGTICEYTGAPANPGDASAIDFGCTLQTLYHKNFDLIAESFGKFLKEGYRILILSDSEFQNDRLREIFADRGDNIEFTPVQRTIHEGFVDHEGKTCFFTDHQIFDRFHKYSIRSDKARNGKLALSLKELRQIEPGDYIVHTDHGIGRFGGLIKSNTNGTWQELIKLVYQNDDIVLVSIHALHKISKYRGKEGVAPKVSKLGTGAWQRIKDRTKQKMKDMARDLIKLYAARRQEQGFAFSPDSYLQQELEASFIYEDTPDQLKATADIKADMESPRPMDRLVCGDVGFGKTELAVRAAFKAAADNKQTAVLVPTTVLAMQHYHTFAERLKNLPVRVEFISRARKPKEVKQILADLAEGKVDILIGTHKLIGRGVKFKDLGLLVVDEEQKFGVAVKEKLKQLKVNVDTLTMSATPIPRTLQFSLMGARDLSALNTPPANRQPILTTVAPIDDDLISEAVNFELSRNGQLFVISNRIENLGELEARLKRLVPGIRVVTAHGQMPPEQLEKAILDFAAHDYDVLLSTTIVENGIDMPNVNTIIINNAQNFGLSELHQLRGRVGRSSRKAFCYMLTPPGLPLTPVARRRLDAIESFSDLGAGIHIAMQDLDIRGAGNLLGAEQSGFIADLGYETYQKILKEAVTELRTEEFSDSFGDMNRGKAEEFTADCVIESDLELRLPPEYVPQESERISLYQQLDNMERMEDVEAFEEHLRDRFGAVPDTATELIKVVPLRMSAKQLGIERLTLKGGKMYLYFVGDDNKAYYQSAAFGKVLSYLQGNPRGANLREVNGKRSMVISGVSRVSEALGILRTMLTADPL